MTSEIRCSLASCGRLLAVVEAGQIEIMCPRCKTVRRVAITDLVAELSAYLAGLQATAATPSTNGKANGKAAIEAGARGFFL